jgi:hypothetical protein
MRNMGIIKNLAMTIRHQQKDNRNMKSIRVSSIIALLVAVAVLLPAAGARATVVDLTSGPGASGTIGGALFSATDQQPAGTGFIDSFLRVQASPTEQGYNTDGGFPFDDKNPHNYQHSVLLSSLSEFNIAGTEYFKFMLDANQSGGSNHTFTMTQLQFYTSNDGAQTTTAFNPDGTLPLGHLAYNMNAGGGTTNSVITTATGSGKYDAIVYVPVSDFNLSDKYVILYFAGQGNGGFEEWTAATNVAPIPEARTIFPIIGLLAAAFSTQFVRRRQLQRISNS